MTWYCFNSRWPTHYEYNVANLPYKELNADDSGDAAGGDAGGDVNAGGDDASAVKVDAASAEQDDDMVEVEVEVDDDEMEEVGEEEDDVVEDAGQPAQTWGGYPAWAFKGSRKGAPGSVDQYGGMYVEGGYMYQGEFWESSTKFILIAESHCHSIQKL